MRPTLFQEGLTQPEPHKILWLLHAANQMDADEAARTARLRTAKAEARVTWLLPEKTSFSQTDKFSTPPEIRRPEHKKARYPDQWHLTAETAEKAQQHTFVTVIQPCHAGEYGKLQPPGCTLAGDCTIGSPFALAACLKTALKLHSIAPTDASLR